jgi:hypothetical protein
MPSSESSPVGKPGSTAIPVQFRAAEFTEFILPHLSRPKRGPQCKLGYHKSFNYLPTQSALHRQAVEGIAD